MFIECVGLDISKSIPDIRGTFPGNDILDGAGLESAKNNDVTAKHLVILPANRVDVDKIVNSGVDALVAYVLNDIIIDVPNSSIPSCSKIS